MKLRYKFLTILLLFFPVLTVAQQTRPARCRVFDILVYESGARSSYAADIGNFVLDGSEGETIRLFNYKQLVITTGVNYDYDYSKKKQSLYRVKIAISVADKEAKSIFEEVDSSEASTADKRNWNLTVTKTVKIDKTKYMFTLSCGEGASYPRRL